MEKKQTAVEWLVEQLKERGYAGEFPPHLLFEQSKEMEKEEIVDAYQQGYNNAYFNNPLRKEQYYNETYGNG